MDQQLQGMSWFLVLLMMTGTTKQQSVHLSITAKGQRLCKVQFDISNWQGQKGWPPVHGVIMPGLGSGLIWITHAITTSSVMMNTISQDCSWLEYLLTSAPPCYNSVNGGLVQTHQPLTTTDSGYQWGIWLLGMCGGCALPKYMT